MGETSEVALSPGINMTKKSEVLGGALTEYTVVTFGDRTISVVDLDMGAQFDLAEVTGGSDNLEYRNLAFVAASVRTIDDHPAMSFGPGAISKSTLRDTLKRLGRDGVKAATAAIRTFSPPEEDANGKVAVGNS